MTQCLATAAGAITSLPFAAVKVIAVGTVETAGSLLNGSTQIVVALPAMAVPAPIIVTLALVMVVPPVGVTSSGCGSDHYNRYHAQRRYGHDRDPAGFGL